MAALQSGKRMSQPVYITEPVHPDAMRLLSDSIDIYIGNDTLARQDILRHVRGAKVLLSKTDPVLIDAELMASAPDLRLVARHGTGFSNVDLDYATENGIAVSIAAGLNTTAISEYTLGLMLAAARLIPQASTACAQGDPDRFLFRGLELTGKTFGIVGVGRIGRAVVERIAAFGMKVLAYHPRPSAKNLTGLPLELVGLDRLLAESDVISLHMPLTKDTVDLIGVPEFEKMKSTAIVLNLSRGGVVNEAALFDALSKNRIFSAATDVLAHEPVRANEPLLTLPNCLVLPHIAAMTLETQRALAMSAAQSCLDALAGKAPPHIVNPKALQHPKWTTAT